MNKNEYLKIKTDFIKDIKEHCSKDLSKEIIKLIKDKVNVKVKEMSSEFAGVTLNYKTGKTILINKEYENNIFVFIHEYFHTFENDSVPLWSDKMRGNLDINNIEIADLFASEILDEFKLGGHIPFGLKDVINNIKNGKLVGYE